MKGMKRIYKNWAVHNIIAHPIMQLLHTLGMRKLGGIIHDATLPPDPDIDITGTKK